MESLNAIKCQGRKKAVKVEAPAQWFFYINELSILEAMIRPNEYLLYICLQRDKTL